MSTILADTVRKTGGTLGVDIRIKNNSVCESEGGTSVTTSISQGLVKAWLKHDSGSAAILDSFNHSSTADIGTGRTDCNLTNAMSGVNNACTGADNAGIACISNQITMTTSRYSSDHFNTNAGFQDAAYCSTQMTGDLA